MMPETILGEGNRRLALLIRNSRSALPENYVHFPSDENDCLQVGVMAWPQGYELAAHIHSPPKVMPMPAEVLFVYEGKIQVDIYDDHTPDNKVQSFVLNAGDIIALLAGGHGFVMLERSVIWEVKTGPYLPTDKKWLGSPSKHSPPAKPTYATPLPTSSEGLTTGD